MPRPPKLIIHATNIHRGGGKVLLTSLLQALPPTLPVLLQADRRMPLEDLGAQIELKRVAPSLAARLAAEKWLARHSAPDDQVLCFGNLPPLYRLAARVSLFVQNRHLVERSDLTGFPLLVRLRLLLERQWLARRLAYCDEVLVQTATMARLVQRNFATAPSVRILPFVEPTPSVAVADLALPAFDFVYVASGEPHKNHPALLNAWCELANVGLRPSLALTVDRTHHATLASTIDRAVASHGLKIVNLGAVQHEEALALYRQARALIYPSSLESFGIPLLEAHQAGLDILAPELDYVRDLLDPAESFDPASPVSIARAVRRYLGQAESRHAPTTASAFLQAVLQPQPLS